MVRYVLILEHKDRATPTYNRKDPKLLKNRTSLSFWYPLGLLLDLLTLIKHCFYSSKYIILVVEVLTSNREKSDLIYQGNMGIFSTDYYLLEMLAHS